MVLIFEQILAVAPFTGAWIEMLICPAFCLFHRQVAPFTGAWIEIERLLELMKDNGDVAPFTGAWIEMSMHLTVSPKSKGRTLHGCVD